MIDDEKAKDVAVLNDVPYYESEVDKIRGRWELASILNFLSVQSTILPFFLKKKSFLNKFVYKCYLKLGFYLQIFEPVLGVDLKLTAEEIESGLVKPDKSLSQLHVKLLKVLFSPQFLFIYVCFDFFFINAVIIICKIIVRPHS